MQTFPPLPADTWFLTGATASGKTALGIELALLLDAEILSLDSMAIFRQLDIGTAKPTAAERARVPHHLLDLVDPADEFSLAEYVAAAHQCAAEVRSRNKQVLLVGGTPLYLKALLRGLFTGPPADWDLRREWEARAAQQAPGWLHGEVAKVDAGSAAKLHPNDTRRLVRALEVFAVTGQPLSQWQQQFDAARPAESLRVFQLDWPRPELHARIDARVHTMLADGWVEEVQHLRDTGVVLGRTAQQAVGYRELFDHLAGVRSLAETEPLIAAATRQFARRQCTWFNSLSELRRIPLSSAVPQEVRVLAESMVETIAALGRDSD